MTVLRLLLLLAILALVLIQWSDLPWWSLFLLPISLAIICRTWLKGLCVDPAPSFIACPICETGNPSGEGADYECYHCGRRFSVLSNRHPALPERVSGT